MENSDEVVETEEPQVIQDGRESPHSDDMESDEEDDALPKSSQQENTADSKLDASNTDSDQACPICMDQWTSFGDHRLCCLRCGHLFGYSCILRWLEKSCNRTNRRCPQCNERALVKHITTLYTRKLTTIDSSRYDILDKELQNARSRNKHLEDVLLMHTNRETAYKQQLTYLRERVKNLERQQQEIIAHTSQNVTNSFAKKFHLERSIEICRQGACRVMDYNPWHKLLAISQKSITDPFNLYGIRKIDCDYFHFRQFILLHSQPIRDLTFHSAQQELLLSVGFDKCAKLTDLRNNMPVHTYTLPHSLWSCCWSSNSPHAFLAGMQNGLIYQFDIRRTSRAVNIMDGQGDRSPVVSMASVPPSRESGINRGGFIACRLNSCHAYEINDSVYMSKQVSLEGPFVSVRYNKRDHHYLISSRPSAKQSYARHVVCTLEKNKSVENALVCNVVHTLHAGNAQQLLSRPCHMYLENDTMVAAHIESNSTISLWSVANGKQMHTLPATEPVIDLCSFKVNGRLTLATLSRKAFKIYNYKQ